MKKERWANIWKLKVKEKVFQVCSVVDTHILTTPAFRLFEGDFKGAIQKGPMYICDIC